MKLWSYWRSSCSYRVRIALNIKGLDYDSLAVHLVKGGGEQHLDEYRVLNPQALVPSFEDKQTQKSLTQSLAIISYLESLYPTPSLLPDHPFDAAQAWSLAHIVACDVQPLQNLRVLRKLKRDYEFSQNQINEWSSHWIELGLQAFEEKTSADQAFSIGDRVTVADLCLIPQLYNARRFNIDLSRYPNILRIETNCLGLEAFKNAAPEQQHDAVVQPH